MNNKRLKNILHNFKEKKILIVGDVMLDKYIFGKVSRISPEAPVPIVEVEKQTCFPGGAAYVATHINNLGGKAYLTGVIGDDNDGNTLYNTLKDLNINIEGLIKESERQTISKTRVIGQRQQIVRIDDEKRLNINSNIIKRTLNYIEGVIREINAVIISDYGKGMVIPSVFNDIIKLSKKFKKPITVDPKPTYCLLYKGVTAITPNTLEVGASVHKLISDEKTLLSVGNELLRRLNARSVLITRGERGMSLFEKRKGVVHIPTSAKEVYDVTGAGDTVISVLTLAIASGASILDSAYLANYAAGIVVGKLGTAKVSLEEIKQVLNKNEK